MNKFKIEIASVPNKEMLVAEISLNNNLIAEINQEKEILEIELYSLKGGKSINLNDFQQILEKAKIKLIG